MPAPKSLHIYDPKVRALAKRLADKRKISVTEAVRQTLEAELQREEAAEPLALHVARIAEHLRSLPSAGFPPREMTKEEIDQMWGH